MYFAIWALIIGVLLTTIAVSGTLLSRLPVSTAMLYLLVGYGLGPDGLAFITPDPFAYSIVLERVAEVAVLISLFAVGLKLGLPLSNKGWRLPLRLATVSMVITIFLISAIGVFGLGLPWGASIILGAILAPTDPVLASDVQVLEANDRDRLRFSLTGEGGLNDGAAFPFVLLGLGLLGLHDLGTWGWRWIGVDVLWSISGGLLTGWFLGSLIGRLVVYLRSRHGESVGHDEFLALGLVALAYGVTVMVNANGFLAVLAAGLALQRVKERPEDSSALVARETGLQSRTANETLATNSEYASAFMRQQMQGFNDQLERVAELAVVLIIGAMLSYFRFDFRITWVVLLIFLVIRPVSVWLGLLKAPVLSDQHTLIAWFGIRGIGSIYYLMYAINHGLARPIADEIVAVTLSVVVVSIVVHGISVTPLMERYSARKAQHVRR
ncbi:cation:proton antiporter [Uliginosibacterium aquaticum]|uniref:Cation:proton antiporter n=1 Tax=Uliginosibacterium aquaticum TaxID=2731212 RepID=A0ABX2IF65_9RHOO|nr:cation:proton antiporter [Uliginosibacterium aquaticum]NSL55067.1 cation:proton antiporter [Uliginosibacterium aquaticum]